MKQTWTYSIWGTQLFYINEDSWDAYIKKLEDEDYRRIPQQAMTEALDYFKWDNLLYQPLTVIIYRAWKNKKLSMYKQLLV